VLAKGKAEGLAGAARRLVAAGSTVEQTAAVLRLAVELVRATVGQAG